MSSCPEKKKKDEDFKSNVIGNSNDETSFTHKLLFSNTKASRFAKSNSSSANIKS